MGQAFSFVACRDYMTIDHAHLSRWSTVPTLDESTSSILRLVTFLLCILQDEGGRGGGYERITWQHSSIVTLGLGDEPCHLCISVYRLVHG